MQEGDRVIVPPYSSWKEDGTPYMVTETEHLTGTIGRLTPIHEGPAGALPGTEYLAWVILDNPIGIQEVVTVRSSLLTMREE